MIIKQTNPNFDKSDTTKTPLHDPKTLTETDKTPNNYQTFLVELHNQTITFNKPIIYIHNNSHYFQINKPLLDATNKHLKNFTQIKTFGDNSTNGINDIH